ncbi:MAG: hypothetical protein OES32_18475, partial [Acidobacteriota bacterium]|nr:hypothetical protein [Acidobacteriota bacterium]
MTEPDPLTPSALRQALHALPRERASPGFTDRLAERLRAARSAPPRRASWIPLATAAAVVLAIGAGLGIQEQRRAARELDQRRALALRHEELRRELDRVRRQVGDPPTLYLGATPD